MKNKIVAILILICLFFTINVNFLFVKKANAIPVVVTSDLPRDTMDRIGITIWKAAGYPLIRDIALQIVTQGDFKITWQNIKDWLITDLLFQTANAILKEFAGFDLCATIGANVRIALLQMYDTEYTPDCTFEQSQIAQLSEKILTGNTDEAWEDVKNYYYDNFHLSLYGSNNEFGEWFQMRDNIDAQAKQRQQNIRFEMLINEGFLGGYDCSGVDPNKGGRIPEDCKVNSAGMAVAELVRGSFRDPMDSALKAQMINDLTHLLGMVVDSIKNRAIYNVYNNL